jgi:uncharacterized protein (DUF1015 family)
MAELVPFAGLRYNPDRVPLSDVLAPPYDVIKGDKRDQLLARNPHNIVAVELAANYGTEPTSEQYQQSANLLEAWKRDGILIHDDASFYVYEQEFAVPGSETIKKRRGVLGALRLEEFGQGVQPHEHTLSGPKADRLNLLRATRTNTSPIFGLYNDESGWVNALLDTFCLSKPICEAFDGEGVAHRLWRMQDDETVNAVVAALEDEPILIADGHHRYETALNFQKECRAQSEAQSREWTGDEDENFVLMMCVATSDEGLIVLPTHRVVKAGAAKTGALLASLSKYFEVKESPAGDDKALLEALDDKALLEALDDKAFKAQPGRLGLHLAGHSYLLQLKADGAHHAAMDAAKSAAYRDLDVSILHSLILENELGIGAEELAAGGHIAYTIDAREAMEKVEGGQWQAAFLMRPTPVEQVQSVANEGDKMPQKSTYFFPKLITGLVLRPIE